MVPKQTTQPECGCGQQCEGSGASAGSAQTDPGELHPTASNRAGEGIISGSSVAFLRIALLRFPWPAPSGRPPCLPQGCRPTREEQPLCIHLQGRAGGEPLLG